MLQLKWNLYLGHTQPLLHGWHNAFASIQRSQKSSDRTARTTALHAASVRYRAELENWLQEGTTSLTEDSSFLALLKEKNVSQRDYHDHLSLMETAKCLWHFCEIMYVDPALNITSQLVDWFQRTEPLPLPSSSAPSLREFSRRDPPMDPDWPVIQRLLVQGRLLEAIDALSKSQQLLLRQPDLLRNTLLILQKAPSVYQREEELSKFVLRFTAWQEHCRKWQGHIDPDEEPDWYRLYGILLGDLDVLRQTAASWSELLIARLLYQKPHMLKEEVKALALECVEEMEEEKGELDRLKRMILKFSSDPPSLLEFLQAVYYNFNVPWFAAHLSDLLLKAGTIPLSPDLQKEADRHRAHYLLEYGLSITSDPLLWQISPTYLLACGPSGRAALRQTVLNRPVLSTLTGLKLLALCDKHSLSGERIQICRRMAFWHFRSGQYGPAVHWFAQGKDESGITSTCAFVLDQHALGEVTTLTNLQAIVDSVAVLTLSRELAFLAKYHHLHLLKEERTRKQQELSDLVAPQFAEESSRSALQNRQQALRGEIFSLVRKGLEIIVRTIVLKVAPRRFWACFLREAVILLNLTPAYNRQPLLSARDTYALMGCFEDLQLSQPPFSKPVAKIVGAASQPDSKQDPFRLSPQEAQAIRLGLSKNLSRIR
eukprot:gb/GEZN01002554.1/.p1 GENE.gb/GEZN01002554.1/~~gb/GEZN01002554.1/.p1  ORF type:complete len:733 (-),score=82.05 gb/GEZN01002554.1/:245-2212(-)